ncbi:MAG: tRNA (adenosine(37)-N6)-threonylcarbamoyltransferase complex dimerization subunit type 1 TsaB [Legionellales bacterium]|nr:tRNA (adenosine(37)-N6)-threonylcarbamoyltransferase complex dimerization subunit type 1 TsaB [Legionellales bacterium]
MKYLAIETSTDRATVAISAFGELFCEELCHTRQHAQELLSMVSRVLRLAKVELNQLDGIVFGRGPGSFTGLRIACGVSIGLAYAHHLPLFPVSTLSAIARAAHDLGERHVLALMDARMNQVYWGHFTGDSFSVHEWVCNASDLVLPTTKSICLAGVGFEPYVAEMPAEIRVAIGKQCLIFPTARDMIHLVQEGHIQAVHVLDARPEYIRNQVTQVKGESGG